MRQDCAIPTPFQPVDCGTTTGPTTPGFDFEQTDLWCSFDDTTGAFVGKVGVRVVWDNSTGTLVPVGQEYVLFPLVGVPVAPYDPVASGHELRVCDIEVSCVTAVDSSGATLGLFNSVQEPSGVVSYYEFGTDALVGDLADVQALLPTFDHFEPCAGGDPADRECMRMIDAVGVFLGIVQSSHGPTGTIYFQYGTDVLIGDYADLLVAFPTLDSLEPCDIGTTESDPQVMCDPSGPTSFIRWYVKRNGVPQNLFYDTLFDGSAYFPGAIPSFGTCNPSDTWGHEDLLPGSGLWVSPANLTSIDIVVEEGNADVTVDGVLRNHRSGRSISFGTDTGILPKAASYVTVNPLLTGRVLITWQTRP